MQEVKGGDVGTEVPYRVYFEDGNSFWFVDGAFTELSEVDTRFFLQTQALLSHVLRETIQLGNALEIRPSGQNALIRSALSKQIAILQRIKHA